MCAEGRPDDNGFGIRIFEGARADAYLRRADVGQKGYTVAIWRGRHVADPTELSDTEMNVELLGNALPHLHAHLVPRYLDDGAPGEPARFMKQPPLGHGRRPEDDVRREAEPCALF